jgi:hypothetical protein
MNNKPLDIFSLSEIPVTLTYVGLGAEPITFFLRPFLQKEDQDLRQAHFALTDKEREGAQHAHNVEMLARLSTRDPEGLTGFPIDDKGATGTKLRSFLTADSPMKVKVAGDALTRYYRVTQPAEFFRGL